MNRREVLRALASAAATLTLPARAQKSTVPQSLQLRADEVIQ